MIITLIRQPVIMVVKSFRTVHILWDSQLDKVKVANNTRQGYKNLIAEVRIYNMDGYFDVARFCTTGFRI